MKLLTLFTPILTVKECSGIAVTIPAGETVEYQSDEIVPGVADLRWNEQTYFANFEDALEASWTAESDAYRFSAWVN